MIFMRFKNTLLVCFLILLCVQPGQAQQSILNQDISPEDSVSVNVVPLTRIPSAMAQTRIKTLKSLDELVTMDDLKKQGQLNDSILKTVEDNLEEIKASTRDSKSVRYLENRKLQLKLQQEKINEGANTFSHMISEMDQSANYFKNEKLRWEATAENLKKNNYSSDMINRIESLNSLLNQALVEISQRTEEIFIILEGNASLTIAIDELMNNIDDSMAALEDELLKSEHPSIFKLRYIPENLEFFGAIKYYLRESAFDLKAYFSANRKQVVINILLFFILLYIFVHYNKELTRLKENSINYYQQKLGHVLSRPLNATIVLSIVFSTFIFRERPLAFRDFMGYAIIFPLLIVSHQLIHKKYHKYVNWFSLLMFPNLIFVMFPPENIFFRYNLIFIAVIESWLMIRFYRQTRLIKDVNQRKMKRILSSIGFIFSILAVIGFLGSVIGSIMLSQILLLSIYYSVFSGAILYASSIMINGLFITYLQSGFAHKINALKNNEYEIRRQFTNAINFISIYLWIVIVFRQLTIWDPVRSTVITFLQTKLSVGDISFSLANIIVFFIVVWISTILSKIIQALLQDDILNKMHLSKGMPHSIAVLVRYSLVTIGMMMAFRAAGLTMSNITVIIGALGVGIGFGLQNIFNNLVSGLILLFERPIQIGDTVEIGELIGKVNSIGIRSSNIRTIDGAEVIVPNGNLVSNEVINWTLSDQQRRIEVIVGVSYSSDPHLVLDLLMGIMKEHSLILQDPEPTVYFQNMGESSLDFRMLFWTSSYGEWLQIRSEVITRVFDLLKENNIEIPFPQRDIHVRSIEEKLNVQNLNNNGN